MVEGAAQVSTSGREAGGGEQQQRQATVESIGCGSAHSLALLSTPRGPVVVAFGRGEDGQLGLGHADDAEEPAVVAALLGRRVSGVHCGAEYSVAVSDEDRQIYSWGWGDFGRLGQADVSDVFLPAPITGLAGVQVAAVACGDTHTLVATAAGEVFAFGRNNAGQLGTGSSADSLAPLRVEALLGKKVVGVAAGAEHSVCVADGGEVFAWGWGSYHCIGDGDNVNRPLPTPVRGLDGVLVRKVACGWRHSAAIDDAGRLWTWGWGRYGQLGHGGADDQPLPKRVAALAGRRVASVTGGWRHTLCCAADGALYAWGWNKFGQLGLGHSEDSSVPQPVLLPAGEAVRQATAGWKHNLAVTASGRVFAWGRGGPLGLRGGSGEDVATPREIESLSAGSADVDALLRGAAAAPAAGHAHMPAADRYAVVPDQSTGAASADEDTVPDTKRQRT